jgi:hypothetical protein
MVILHRKSNPDVNAFMSANDISSYEQLDAYFFENRVSLLDSLNSKYIVDEEAFLYNATLPKSTVVEMRKVGGFDALAEVGFFFPHNKKKKNCWLLVDQRWHVRNLLRLLVLERPGDWRRLGKIL